MRSALKFWIVRLALWGWVPYTVAEALIRWLRLRGA
jgi:hypothetical protein